MLDITQYDEDTLSTVYRVLMAYGLTQAAASDAISGLQNEGIVFRERVVGEGLYITDENPNAKVDATEGPVNAQPKEWIERQEEERRAWAVNTACAAIEHASAWSTNSLIELAGKIEAYVKGPEKEDPDLHDQDAFDTWGVVMTEQLSEMLFSKSTADLTDQERDFIEARLNDFSDSLTKQGVRFKNGERFDRLVDDA